MSTVQTAGLILPTDPEARSKIKIAIKEISNSMTRTESEKDNIKAIVETLASEHQLPKPAINKIAKIYHKQSKSLEFGQMEDIQSLYETVFESDED